MDISSKQKRIQTWKAILNELSSANPSRKELFAYVLQYEQLLYNIWSGQCSSTEDSLISLQALEAKIESAAEDLRASVISNIPTAKLGSIM
jgi:hypothetical protein